MTTIVSGAVSVSKLINDPPDILAESIVRGIRSNYPLSLNTNASSFNTSTNIISAFTAGFTKRIDTFFNYGKDHYSFGLPGVMFRDPAINEEYVDLVIPIIEGEIGEEIIMYALKLGRVRPRYLAFEYLVKSNLYEKMIFSEQFSSISFTDKSTGFTYKVKSVTHVGTTLSINYSQTEINPNNPKDRAESDVIQSIIIDLTSDLILNNHNILPGDIVFQAIYILESTLDRRVWTFKPAISPSVSIHPSLDLPANIAFGDYGMPILHLIRNGTFIHEDLTDNDSLIEQTERMFDMIGIEYDDLVEAIDDPGNEADLSNVSNAFVSFILNLDSNVDVAIRYMYYVFRKIHYDYTEMTQQEWVDDVSKLRAYNGFGYGDAGVSMGLFYTFSTIEVINGHVDTYTTVPNMATIVPLGAEIDPNDDGTGQVTKQIVEVTNNYSGDNQTGYNTHLLILRKQLTSIANGDVSDTLVQLVISGIENRMWPRAPTGEQASVVRFKLDDVASGGVFLPVLYDYAAVFNGIDRSYLYYDSLHLVINAADVTELSWYQEPTFIYSIGVISNVITVVLIFTGIGDAWNAAAKELGKNATTTAIAQQAGKNLVYNLVIKALIAKGIKLLGQEIGVEFLAVIATIAAAYSTTMVDAEKIFGLIDAEELLELARISLKQAKLISNQEILRIAAEAEKFQEEYLTEQEKLEQIEEELNRGLNLTVYDTINTNKVIPNFNETPTEFFNRSVMNNPGHKLLICYMTTHQ